MDQIAAEGVPMYGDDVGSSEFFSDAYETLLRAMYLLTGDRYEAEELARDAFVKACERWDASE